MLQLVQDEPRTWPKKNKNFYINFIFLPLNKKFEHPEPKFCLNLVEISLNIIILVLLSQ